MLILFPSDYFNVKKIEPDYSTEYDAVTNISEFETILYNYDSFVLDGIMKIYPENYYTGDCIYRGWMLNPDQYRSLYKFLMDKGVKLINSPEEYILCHIFPEAYKVIEPYTPRSLCFEHGKVIDWELVNRTFNCFMIKDYVKSVKETGFPSFFRTPVEAEEMDRRISEFIEMRDKLYTGGIVLKEYVDLKKYGETSNEYRAFFLNRQLISLSRNSNQCETCNIVPLDFVMKFNKMQSNYYTVDFAELSDGSWIVIETGDGQVSGLSPNQHINKYYDDIRKILCK